MLKLSDTGVAGAAQQPTHRLGIVAMIDSKAKFWLRGLAADRAAPALFREHHVVGFRREAVQPAKVRSAAYLWVFRGPFIAGVAVARGVFLSACHGRNDRARLAVVGLSVWVSAVAAEVIHGFYGLAPRAAFLPFGSLPSWMRVVARLGVANLTISAVSRKAVWALLANVEGRRRLHGFTLGAKLFNHDDLLGRNSYWLKTLSLSTGGF